MSRAALWEEAAALDAADPLAGFRERFEHPRTEKGERVIYLCGHSLGLLPREARARLLEELEDWSALGVAGHTRARRPWIDYHENLARGLAALAGAAVHEVVAMNSLTVNLHLLLASFYRPRGTRRRILIEAGAFSSDRHAVVSQIEWHGEDPAACLAEIAPRDGEELLRAEDIERRIAAEGERLALVLWPGVQFRTGQAFDLGRIARAGHAAGAVVGFDLAHAIGNVPLHLHADGADFAVWCSYKYLNAGPGAIGGAFVHERHARPEFAPRLAGWWGHDIGSRFDMEPGFRAAHGAPGWAISNPPIFSAAPLIASLALFEEAGLERLREKSLALTGFLERALGRELPGEARIVTAAEPGARGAQLSIRIRGDAARSRRVFERLLAAGIACDWRPPDILRAAPVPLYNRFADVAAFVEALGTALHAEPLP